MFLPIRLNFYEGDIVKTTTSGIDFYSKVVFKDGKFIAEDCKDNEAIIPLSNLLRLTKVEVLGYHGDLNLM